MLTTEILFYFTIYPQKSVNLRHIFKINYYNWVLINKILTSAI